MRGRNSEYLNLYLGFSIHDVTVFSAPLRYEAESRTAFSVPLRYDAAAARR